MDTATLLLVDLVLRAKSLREAARLSHRPPASIAAAITRCEDALSARLCQRAGSGLAFTLEANRLAPSFAEAARLARRLYCEKTDPFASPVRLQALERFMDVAERGSIKQAALAMGLGQPQLSRQLAHLERASGQALLQRDVEGTRLTAAGESLRRDAAALLALWAEMSHSSDTRFRRSQATVRLGSIMPLGYESEIARQLAKLTAHWADLYPRQPLFISSTTAEELLRGLKSGAFDAVLLDTEAPPDDLEGARIARSGLAIIGAKGTGIAEALSSRAIALPSPRSGLRQRIDQLLERTFDAAARDRLTLLEIDSIPVILNLVLHYGFVSVLPLASVAALRPGLPMIALPAAWDMQYWLCWPKAAGRAHAGAAILQALQHAIPAATADLSHAPLGTQRENEETTP